MIQYLLNYITTGVLAEGLFSTHKEMFILFIAIAPPTIGNN